MTSPNYESLERHQQLEHQHPPAGGVPIYPGTPVSSPYYSYKKFYTFRRLMTLLIQMPQIPLHYSTIYMIPQRHVTLPK